MKTALTELIEEFEKWANSTKNDTVKAIWERAAFYAKEKLPKQRQQIEDAYNKGEQSVYDVKVPAPSAKYFKQTFEQ